MVKTSAAADTYGTLYNDFFQFDFDALCVNLFIFIALNKVFCIIER